MQVVAVRDQLNAIMHFAIDALAIVTGAVVHGSDFRSAVAATMFYPSFLSTVEKN